jgi:ribonuclease HI
VIYADGACHPNPGIGGWGFVVYNDCTEVYHEFGGDLDATNQTMELTAALRALQWIIGQDFKPPIDLFSDSAYTVNGCNDWRHGWRRNGWKRKPKSPNGAVANLELWQALDAALTIVPIKLQWVKGHAGIIGNERADELSEMGRGSVLPKTGMDMIAEQLAGAYR